ncbi:MAG: response regulator transcription factor [Candidatus Levybacteria bacterium]|nr:response regulator transcription factor [Candidatus Levybacteria bacterium]MBP9815117.1 response regulator transcription factor [Candidatus Levybacteria bacterium]
MNKILVVEDDDAIRDGICDFLTSNNYLVESVSDGASAIASVKRNLPDLVILDLTLPKITGESVCTELKKSNPELPVIILTAKNKSTDVLGGFSLGADDYISKPFELEELMVRIRARIKKNYASANLEAGDLVLDPKSLLVTRGGKEITLTPHEFKLLEFLLMNKGKVLNRDMILSRVWEYSYDVDTRVVDVYVGYLRKKIDSGYTKKLIISKRGFGYVIQD